jgi:glycosyltransferase involved in cell wall biosynthesis
MPVYNGERYVRRAIDALLAQTFVDFELVISDNVSSDATRAICEGYARRDPRVRYIRQGSPLPVEENFLLVLREARGEYFMWQADDDRWGPEWLARATAILDAEPKASLVFANFEIYNFQTRKSTLAASVLPAYGSPFRRVGIRLLDPVANLIYGLFRTSHQPPPDIFGFDLADIFFTLWMAEHGEIHIVPDRLFEGGVKQNSLSPRAVDGKRVSLRSYYLRASRLIRQNFRGVRRVTLLALLTRQVLLSRRSYRLRLVDG